MSAGHDTGANRDALHAFAKLNRADRLAIIKRLAPRERRQLLALERTDGRGESEVKLADWPAYSPALGRHIVRLVSEAEAGTSKLTARAQAALHDCLSAPQGDSP